MTKTKHHFVPCAYLQWFSSNLSLWRKSVVEVFDAKNQKNRPTSVESIMYEKNFYDIDTKWIPVDFAEDFFNNTFERWLATVIAKIDRKKQLNLEEINQICTFIWFQEFRTHYRKDRINQIYEKIQEYWIKTSDNEKLKTFFRNMFIWDQVIWTILQWRKWYIFQSKNWDFITSDHPLYLLRPKNIEKNIPIGAGNASLCFPISKYSYLIAKYWEDDLPWKNWWTKNIVYSEADDTLIKLSNRYSCWDINRFVIWENENSLQDIMDIIKWDKTIEDCKRELESIL